MRPLLLIVLDGFGERAERTANAIRLAKTPTLDHLYQTYPSTLLSASGLSVGLPEGQMGNSEVGHMTLGAGRVMYQDLPRISKAIEDGSFFHNEVLLRTMEHVKKHQSTLHIIGLTSEGGVHSHIDHGLAIARLCKIQGISRVAWHAILDGRDTPPISALPSLERVENELSNLGIGHIASLVGRFYAMDRDQRWERTKMAYDLLVHGQGRRFPRANGMRAALQSAYAQQETDEFVKPIVLFDEKEEVISIRPMDAVVFFNFRADRARQLILSLTDPTFHSFDRSVFQKPLYVVCMTQYDQTFQLPVLFPSQVLHNHLGEYFSKLGIRQFRIAETEKYAHVTFFFNGGREAPYPGETRQVIPSRRDVATYDQAPEMSALDITSSLATAMRTLSSMHANSAIHTEGYGFFLVNFANPDMVGHTGSLEATIRAVEVIDGCLHQLIQEAQLHDMAVIITADHGNCEQMWDEGTGQLHTAHTTNPVPFLLVDSHHQHARLRSEGGLSDVAPTILEIMGLPVPKEMTGRSLFVQSLA